MSERSDRLESIATTIRDYRAGEIAEPTPEHVDQWVTQFDVDVQVPILVELDHVLKKTYINRDKVLQFLRSLINTEKLVGADPCSFWRDVKFLDIQGAGNSQREMLSIFNTLLFEECGLEIVDCGINSEVFLYLDDASFTGNRILGDLSNWIRVQAPNRATVYVVTFALHRGGHFYAEREIQNVARANGKEIELRWWRCLLIEDRMSHINTSDVLRPTSLPDDQLIRDYAASLRFRPTIRLPGGHGENEFFSSEEGRHVLEQHLLTAGANIRDMCPYLNKYQRPLGNVLLETLGFGSTLVTFRNCPNNTPLAFWVDNPWYPLFPRKIN